MFDRIIKDLEDASVGDTAKLDRIKKKSVPLKTSFLSSMAAPGQGARADLYSLVWTLLGLQHRGRDTEHVQAGVCHNFVSF